LRINSRAKTVFFTPTNEAKTDPAVVYAPLDLNTIVSLSNTAPIGDGSQVGTINIKGANGSYPIGSTSFTATSSGYVQTHSFSPASDQEYYALDVLNASQMQLTSIVSDIDGVSGLTASLSPQGGTNSTLFSGIFNTGGTLVYVTAATGVGTDPFLGFNFGNDSSLTGVELDGVAAVPEPTSLGLLALGGIAMMRRRRVNRAPMGN
jgi:hypothetical protein